MQTYNVHAAKTHLSKLLQRVAEGETIVIAHAGRPVAQLVPMPPSGAPTRLGFLNGTLRIPDDFDSMGADTIESRFRGQ